jgi:hypothetical protein
MRGPATAAFVARDGIAQRRFDRRGGLNRPELDAQLRNGLGDGRRDAGDDGLAAHQHRSLGDLDQVVRHGRVDDRDSADIEHERARAGVGDAGKGPVHDIDGAFGIDDPHDGREEHPIPDLGDGSGHLEHGQAPLLHLFRDVRRELDDLERAALDVEDRVVGGLQPDL